MPHNSKSGLRLSDCSLGENGRMCAAGLTLPTPKAEAVTSRGLPLRVMLYVDTLTNHSGLALIWTETMSVNTPVFKATCLQSFLSL